MRKHDGKELLQLWRFGSTVIAAKTRQDVVEILEQEFGYPVYSQHIKRLKHCAADRKPGIII